MYSDNKMLCSLLFSTAPGDRKKSCVARAATALLLMTTAIGIAVGGDPVGTVVMVEGTVDAIRGDTFPAVPLNAGDPVLQGDLIRTRSNSRARVEFNNGNILKIAQRSRVDINEYLHNGMIRTEVGLQRGRVRSIITEDMINRMQADPGLNSFEIHTSVAVIGVRGTDFFVSHHRNITGVNVIGGVVEVYNRLPDERVTVTAGQVTTITSARPPSEPRDAMESETARDESETTVGETFEDKGPAFIGTAGYFHEYRQTFFEHVAMPEIVTDDYFPPITETEAVGLIRERDRKPEEDDHERRELDYN